MPIMVWGYKTRVACEDEEGRLLLVENAIKPRSERDELLLDYDAVLDAMHKAQTNGLWGSHGSARIVQGDGYRVVDTRTLR